jgi:hypothetical protein
MMVKGNKIFTAEYEEMSSHSHLALEEKTSTSQAMYKVICL